MFFSLDVILKERLHILEINSGYTSGFGGLGQNMTEITYLHSLLNLGPVLVVGVNSNVMFNQIENATTIDKMISLADQVLTSEERSHIYFIPYDLDLEILMEDLEDIAPKAQFTGEELIETKC